MLVPESELIMKHHFVRLIFSTEDSLRVVFQPLQLLYVYAVWTNHLSCVMDDFSKKICWLFTGKCEDKDCFTQWNRQWSPMICPIWWKSLSYYQNKLINLGNVSLKSVNLSRSIWKITVWISMRNNFSSGIFCIISTQCNQCDLAKIV